MRPVSSGRPWLHSTDARRGGDKWSIEIGIEPTVRHGADLGYIPVVVTDACGAGNEDAGRGTLEVIEFVGDAVLTDTDTICKIWHASV